MEHPASRTAPCQIFHRDVTGAWSVRNLTAGGAPFDWDPHYPETYRRADLLGEVPKRP